jgi:hypothetical protein
MKTPKEILLETHQALAPRLNQLREDVLATELSRAAADMSAKPPSRKNIIAAAIIKLWNELIWPSRRAWAGLAAIWIALAVVHFSQKSSDDSTNSAPNPQMMADWDEQQKLQEQFVNQHMQVAEKTTVLSSPPANSGKSAESASDGEEDWA